MAEATPRIPIPEAAIRAFCERWGVSELALFGSVLRDDFGPDSDVDVLVTFEDGSQPTLIDLGRMERELEVALGRDVDLVSRRGVERGRPTLRRTEILDSAQAVYAAS